MIFRFSLVADHPIPHTLIAHVRRLLARAASNLRERPVRAHDLDAYTWCGKLAGSTQIDRAYPSDIMPDLTGLTRPAQSSNSHSSTDLSAPHFPSMAPPAARSCVCDNSTAIHSFDPDALTDESIAPANSCSPSSATDLYVQLRALSQCANVNCAWLSGELAQYGPRAIITDVDATFITTEVIEMLAQHAGSYELVQDITRQAMSGEMDFRQSLNARVATLSGLPRQVFDDILHDIRPTSGADQLVHAVHQRDGYFGLVSGGFDEIVGPLAQRFQIDAFLANHLEIHQGKLTGRVTGPVVDAEAKVAALLRWCSHWGIRPEQVVCVGDGANDLPMMAAAGAGIAFCGKPLVTRYADAAVNIPRLDAVAALLGWDLSDDD
ncbi:phosphoserine phosphatase SerB [Trueperella sp. LYQ141]|uniref:phosphoserine phosphatase SerB n=1 Tax=Trueperella sp. LYQ141 TaxID=3391058 RepID=UPI0039839459